MLLKYVLAWVPMVLIAIGNAAIREASYRRFMGELRAHQLSTLIAIILFGVYIWALTRVWPIQSSAQALTIGLIWLGLTVVFEFVFGHYVMANSWERLFHDYNLTNTFVLFDKLLIIFSPFELCSLKVFSEKTGIKLSGF
jgi:hypothetical protein